MRNKFLEYEGVSKRIPSIEKDVRIEVLRYFRHRMNPTQQRHKQDANSIIRSSRSIDNFPEYSHESGQAIAESGVGGPHIPRILPSTQYGLAIMRENSNVDDSELINDQRRLSQCVENVLCAYLNRNLVSQK